MEEKLYNLSNTQKNIWLIDQHYPNTNINNIVGLIDFKNSIDVLLLKEAVNILVKKNEALRLRIISKNGEPIQYIEDFKPFDIEILEIINTEEYIEEFLNVKIDIEEDRLYHFEILKNKSGKVKLISRFHHIITDAWSLSLIISEIVKIYSDLKSNVNIGEEEYYSYTNFIVDDRKYNSSDRYYKDQKYWNSVFDTEPPILNLKSEVDNNKSEAERLEIQIDIETSNKIKKFCESNSISQYCLFLTCTQLLFCKKYNTDDIIIGNPFLNRKNKNEKEAIGIFINTLPVRLKTVNEETIIQLLQRNSRVILNTLRHERYPYQDVQDFVKNRYGFRQNLYNILFSYQNAKDNRKNIDVNYSTEWIFNKNIADELQIHVHDRDDNDTFNLVYDFKTSIFNINEIKNINNIYIKILNQILNNKDKKIKDISILDKKTITRILNKFNNNKMNFKKEMNSKNIYNLILKFNKSNRNNIAIEEENKTITYGELFDKVDKLVSRLNNEYCIKEKENIGIITDKNIDTIIGILAIIKMNCTVVPIDSNYPMERQEYMLSNANVKTLLYTKSKANYLDVENEIEISNLNNGKYENTQKKYKYDINNNLYIIYTSGSTGEPKPVTISHKNIMNLILYELKSKELAIKNSRILQFATLSFDVSYQEIFTALLSGSTLVLIDEETKKDNNKLAQHIINKEIEILFIPPRYLIYLAENQRAKEFKKKLQHIITAGEQLILTDGIERLIEDGILIHNHYGPAETHVATTYVVNKNNMEYKVPIR